MTTDQQREMSHFERDDEFENVVRNTFVAASNRYPDERYVSRMAQRMRAGTLSEKTLRGFYRENPPKDALLEQASRFVDTGMDVNRMRFDPQRCMDDPSPLEPTRSQMPDRIRRKFFSR